MFLCHNSMDKPQVRQLAEDLVHHGFRPWFDEWCLVPGRPWQRALEAQISTISAAAVIVGDSGIGPWHELELEAFMREFVSRGLPVIPVVLPGTDSVPDLPLFLRGLHWVDFRRATPDPMQMLTAGITGTVPYPRRS